MAKVWRPLQCHHIDNAESVGMEGKEEHLQELPAAQFGAGMVVFKQCGHLFFGKMLAVKKDNDFAQTSSDFGKKNHILDKQTAPFEAIKHQRDKQILIVHRADI